MRTAMICITCVTCSLSFAYVAGKGLDQAGQFAAIYDKALDVSAERSTPAAKPVTYIPTDDLPSSNPDVLAALLKKLNAPPKKAVFTKAHLHKEQDDD